MCKHSGGVAAAAEDIHTFDVAGNATENGQANKHEKVAIR